jgi:CRISPR/Cas system-associated exonuclease Cas4 (RecB family)
MGIVVKSLSYSTVNSYISCPEKCMLEKIDHVPKKGVSANLVNGTCLHAAAEAYYRGLYLNRPFDINILFRVFSIMWEQTPENQIIYSAKEKTEIFDQAHTLLELLIKHERPHQILAIERPLTYQLSNDLKIVGRPDLIFRDKDGWLTIVDLKSSSKSYGIDERYNATSQIFGYALALQEPVKLRVRLFLKLKEPRIEDVILNPDDIDYTEWKDRFIGVKRAIENNIRFKSRSWQCKSCSFAYLCNKSQNLNYETLLDRKAA